MNVNYSINGFHDDPYVQTHSFIRENAINSAGHLNRIARVAVLDSLVEHGVGEWIRDKKHKAECLILWKNVHEWAESIFAWAKSNQHSIVLLEDLRSGFDVEKTEIEGMPDEILLPALKELERKGKIKRFRSDNGQIGVKFFLHMI